MYILNQQTSCEFDIEAVCEKYNAKYMGVWCLKTRNGNWAEEPSAVFYVENPDMTMGHTHYFGLFSRMGSVYITKGDSAFENQPLSGVIADNGEVLISRYRHDYTKSEDNTVWIDGGRDYTRSGMYAPAKFADVSVMDGVFYVNGEQLEEKSE